MKTADLCDKFEGRLQIAEPVFRDFGGKSEFSGVIHTVKWFEDNSLVRAALKTPGNGGVLVADGGGSLRCALLGDVLAALAVKNGWSGVVINGCVRDTEDLAKIALGVKALAAHPRKSAKNDYGEANVPVTFAGVTFTPGHFVYADTDEMVVSERLLAD